MVFSNPFVPDNLSIPGFSKPRSEVDVILDFQSNSLTTVEELEQGHVASN